MISSSVVFSKTLDQADSLVRDFKHGASSHFHAHGPSPRGRFYRSGTAEKRNAAAQGNLPGETNRNLFTLHNYGHLLPASRQDKHLL
jgi:hypothetical protein